MIRDLYDSFQFKILTLKGTEFQSFFEGIYQNLYGLEFHAIKPHGRLGDGGNDGWMPSLGYYFQVYGPDAFNLKIEKSVTKMKSDFVKIIDNWNHLVKINAFFMVVNDRFSNCPAPLSKALAEISQNYNIKCYFVGAAYLWSEFKKLDSNTQMILLGGNVSILPDDIVSIINIIDRELEMQNLPRMNENIISCALHFSLVEKLPSLQSKLNYYNIPPEYDELNYHIENLIYWFSKTIEHFENYEFCELVRGSLLLKTKRWKTIDIPQDIYIKYSNLNDAWELKHQKLCNNLAYCFNQYLVYIRRIFDSNYLLGFFSFDIFYKTPGYLVKV